VSLAGSRGSWAWRVRLGMGTARLWMASLRLEPAAGRAWRADLPDRMSEPESGLELDRVRREGFAGL
jgi:hypothetical protein